MLKYLLPRLIAVCANVEDAEHDLDQPIVLYLVSFYDRNVAVEYSFK